MPRKRWATIDLSRTPETLTLGRRCNGLWLAWDTCQPMNPPETQRKGETQVAVSEEEGLSPEQEK